MIKLDNILNAAAILPIPIAVFIFILYEIVLTGEEFTINILGILLVFFMLFMLIIGIKEIMKGLDLEKDEGYYIDLTKKYKGRLNNEANKIYR